MQPNFSPGWQSKHCCYPNAYNLAQRKMLWRQNCLITLKAVGWWRLNRLPAGKGMRDALHDERQVALGWSHNKFSIWSRSGLTHVQTGGKLGCANKHQRTAPCLTTENYQIRLNIWGRILLFLPLLAAPLTKTTDGSSGSEGIML